MAGWLFGARFLAGQWSGAIPMAPSTALAFLLLSGGVFSHARWPERRRSRYFTPVSIGLTALLGLLVLAQFIVGFDSGVERMLARTNELFGHIPLGRMSPLTAASFLLESGALMLVLRANRWRFADSMAALLVFTVTATNVVVLVGYAYGAPLLYGGSSIPVALPTALAFVLLGMGQIRLALHGVPALRAWRGDSMRGMLLRAFLPVILLVILLEGWLDSTVVSMNPALWDSLTALLSVVLIVVISGWIARRTGDAIERAQEALRESREVLQAVLNSIPVRVFWKDRNLVYLGCNTPFAQDAGFEKPEDIIGKDDHATNWREQAERYRADDRAVIESGVARFLFEEPQTKPSGEQIHLLTSKVPLRDASGVIVGVLGTYYDITDRQQTLEALQKSEERLRLTLEAAGVVAWEINCVDGTHHEAGPVDKLFGRVEGFGHPEVGDLMASIHPEDRERISAIMESARRGECEYKMEYRVPQETGGEKWIAANGTLLRDVDGKPVRLLGVAVDITERKRAEEELRASEERSRVLARALQCADECISITDIEDRILYVNEAFCRTYGYREDELIGQQIGILRSGRTSNEIQDEILPATMVGRWQGELWNRTKEGRDFLISLTTSLVYDEGGQTVALVGIARDITERKQAEEESAELQAQLYQAQKMESVGRLAGGVAHDFNNLLTVINGYSQMLVAKLSAGDPLRDSLEEIHKAGERAAGLTRQLLAFSRKQVLEPRRLDVNRVVGEMRPMLVRLVGEDVEVRVALHAKDGTIHADPHQLEQVVMNLAVNSRDAMPHGGKLLIDTAVVEWDERHAHSHPEARVGRYVVLSVSDSGVGMDEETKSRIFEPFFTTKGMGKGTGLGLSMVQGIVAQSGGYIEVHSEKGTGTTFKIYLPVLTEGAADDWRPAAVPALGGKETVLVVEDQAEVRKYAVAALKAKGYRAIPAENAGEALLIFERERVDLVLTDVVMPNVSGRELADRLEKLQPGIKVLFMSGYTDDVIASRGILDEGARFIQKPFSPEELAGKVREVLDATAPAVRILVADDEASVRSFLRKVLEGSGYEVIEAENGKQAIQEARAGRVDLVITDLVMPEQEGIETIQALRRDVPGVVIIAISGAFEGQFLNIAKMLGAAAVLAKPVTADLLLAKVAEVLRARR